MSAGGGSGRIGRGECNPSRNHVILQNSSFTIDTTAPGLPGQSTPANGSTVYTLQPTVQWNAANDTNGIWKYHLKVVENWLPYWDKVDKDVGNVTAYTLSSSEALEWEENYVWRLYAVDVAGNSGNYTGERNFSTHDGTAPSTPDTPDLDPGSDSGQSNSDKITNDNTPTFSWAASSDNSGGSGLDGYQYKLGNGSWTSTGNGTTPSVTLPTQPDGTYTIYVRAYDKASPANYSGSSPGLSFT